MKKFNRFRFLAITENIDRKNLKLLPNINSADL